jgi:hypothetical protein
VTIGTTSIRASFNCDGVTKIFPVPIQAYLATDFTVILTAPVSAGGAQTVITLNSDYSLAASSTDQPPKWTLTTLAAGAYAAGYTLQVICSPVETQNSQYVQGQSFPSQAVQTNLDRLTQMVQRLTDQVSRSVHVPDGDVAPAMQLPIASVRAGLALICDANGNIGIGVIPTAALTQTIFNAFLALSGPYAETALEIAAGTTPINYSKFPSPWKDISRFVTDNTGGLDVSGQFANAIKAEKNIVIPQGIYNLGTTGLVLPANLRMEASGRGSAILKYAGTGFAVDGFGQSDLALSDFSIDTTGNAAATALRFGNGAQHIYLNNIECDGENASGANSGIGLLLDAANPGTFSGNLLAQLFYTLGYKIGVKFTGHDVGLNTWTSVSFLQSYILGRAAGIIAGSIGLWMDPNTNGVGSMFHGGTIESFATGLRHDNGGYGIDFAADIEGNTLPYTVGASFAGRIRQMTSTGNSFEQAANGSGGPVWFCGQQLSGQVDAESYYGPRVTVYDDSTNSAEWAIYRGPISSGFIRGAGNPTKKFAIVMGIGSDNAGARNFLRLNGQTVHWDTQSPQTTGLGTWAEGDVCYNSSAAVGSPKGWTCTVAGSPGTWVSQGNL